MPVSKSILKEFSPIELKKIPQNSSLKGNQFFSDNFLKKYYSEQILGINLKLK